MIARTCLAEDQRAQSLQVRETLVVISRRCVAVTILALLGGAIAARAQDTSSAPAGTCALANTPFQLILPRQHLFSDRYGTRAWLEEHGITPTLTSLTDALGNPTGGHLLQRAWHDPLPPRHVGRSRPGATDRADVREGRLV